MSDFKVGDIVSAASWYWDSKHIGLRGVVKSVHENCIVVEMLEDMPGAVQAGFEWWIESKNWTKAQQKSFVCKSLL